jgi:hypothetical protein
MTLAFLERFLYKMLWFEKGQMEVMRVSKIIRLKGGEALDIFRLSLLEQSTVESLDTQFGMFVCNPTNQEEGGK